jgi:hypothetical protein
VVVSEISTSEERLFIFKGVYVRPTPNAMSTDGQGEDWAVWHRDGDGYWFVECVIAIYHTSFL